MFLLQSAKVAKKKVGKKGRGRGKGGRGGDISSDDLWFTWMGECGVGSCRNNFMVSP